MNSHHRTVHLAQYKYHCDKCGHGLQRQSCLKTHRCDNVNRKSGIRAYRGRGGPEDQELQADNLDVAATEKDQSTVPVRSDGGKTDSNSLHSDPGLWRGSFEAESQSERWIVNSATDPLPGTNQTPALVILQDTVLSPDDIVTLDSNDSQKRVVILLNTAEDTHDMSDMTLNNPLYPIQQDVTNDVDPATEDASNSNLHVEYVIDKY